MRLLFFTVFCICLSGAPSLQGHVLHEARRAPPPGPWLAAGVASSWRSEAIVAEGQRWVVPGFLMGGEALPRPRGFHLDEAALAGSFRRDAGFIAAVLSQHGEHEAAWEQFWFGHMPTEQWLVEVGRMDSLLNKRTGLFGHPSRFTDTPLIEDVFWGRHWNDTGLRLRNFRDELGLELGLELWQGESFPSDRDERLDESGDVFLRWYGNGEAWQSRLGLFYFQGTAARRKDDRYEAGHAHGVDLDTIPEYVFSGRTAIYGAEAAWMWRWTEIWSAGLEAVAQDYRSRGTIRDLTRTAGLDTSSRGVQLELYGVARAHRAAVRYERLQFLNKLTGPAAAVLADVTGLQSTTSPFRLTVGYQYQWSEPLQLRVEWTRDQTTGRQIDLGVLSCVWYQANLLAGL